MSLFNWYFESGPYRSQYNWGNLVIRSYGNIIFKFSSIPWDFCFHRDANYILWYGYMPSADLQKLSQSFTEWNRKTIKNMFLEIGFSVTVLIDIVQDYCSHAVLT